MNPARALDHQGPGRRIVTEVAGSFRIASIFRVIRHLGSDIAGAYLRPLKNTQLRPILGSTDDLSNQGNQDLALVAALQAELAADVAELTELAAEAGKADEAAAADAEVLGSAAGSESACEAESAACEAESAAAEADSACEAESAGEAETAQAQSAQA